MIYTPIYTILDEKVETMLRCARSFDEKCVWYKIPKDVFNLIIKALAFLPISENTSSKITSLLSKEEFAIPLPTISESEE